MDFTFGIITDGHNPHRVQQVISSIETNNIQSYEIIVVGGTNPHRKKTVHINFNESGKPAWITRKKNIITDLASRENIVYMHDYIALKPDWYEGYKAFGNKFAVCINPLKNLNGTRYRDLSLFPAFRDLSRLGFQSDKDQELFQTVTNMGEHECLIPYENYNANTGIINWMYISGAYWVAKKYVMTEFRLNESLTWGQGEDVIWSEQVKRRYKFDFNIKSECVLLKHKDPIFKLLSESTIKQLKDRNILV